MKRKLFTRLICLAVAAALTLGMLTGCAKKDGSTATMSDLKYYKIETVDTKLTDLCDYPNEAVLIVDGVLYATGYKYVDTDNGNQQVNLLLSCNLDGSQPAAVTLTGHPFDPAMGYSNVYGPLAVENGTAIMVENTCANWEEGDEQNYINTVDLATGEIVNSVEISNPDKDTPYLNLYNARYADGKLIVTTDTGLLVFDAAGSCKTVKVIEGEGYVSNIYTLGDGSCLVSYYDAEWSSMMKKLDMTTGTLGAELTLPSEVNNCTLISDGKGQLYGYSGDVGIYKVDLTAGSAQLICNWLDSDIDANSEIGTLFANDDGSFTSIGRGENWDKLLLSTLTYVDPTTLPEKTVLTLACNYSWAIRSAVLKFNRGSDTTRITVVDYNSYSTEENNYTGAATQMNTDIISGKCPDILLVDASLPFDSYVAKGLFTDLYPLMDADPDVDRDDLLENVLHACENDGKLTSIVPLFGIVTLAGRADYLGENPGWSWEEFHAVLDANPQCQYAIDYMNRENMLQYMVMFGGASLVNTATGECHFDSQEFINMLEYAKTYPEEYPYNEDMSDKQRYGEGYTLLTTASIWDFSSVKDITYNMDGEVVYKGFPNEDGTNGAMISPDVQLAIAEGCADKAAAWDFVSYFLTEEYFENNSYNLPLSKTLLNQQAEKAMTPDDSQEYAVMQKALSSSVVMEEAAPTQTIEETGEETGEIAGDVKEEDAPFEEADVAAEETAESEIAIEEPDVDNWEEPDDEYENYWSKPVTQAQVDQLMAIITGAKAIYHYDSALFDIIKEEAAAFFAGSKSAADTAAVIQGRAQTYLSESR